MPGEQPARVASSSRCPDLGSKRGPLSGVPRVCTRQEQGAALDRGLGLEFIWFDLGNLVTSEQSDDWVRARL